MRSLRTRARHAVEDAVEIHVLVGGEFVVDAGVLKHDAELLARGGLMGGGVETVELHVAAGGRQQRGEHLDGGGFAGAVGAQEGEDLALGDIESDIVDGGEVAEFLD